uniref:Fork-head domain-containing protein n=1 Tax=Panagrolaimus sp. PS1159 TaxID=55785 RepID=A0AC35FT37_9BILA
MFDDDGHFLGIGLSESLDGVFPDEILNGFNEDFNCNIDDIMNDCSSINTNSVDCYFPTENVQTEFLDDIKEEVDFSKVKTEKSSSSKKPYIKQPKREPEECKNGYCKPNYPYSCLISLALKNSTDGQLSVADIYSFVCENFPFFEYANPGWKNSIRHNLSLNKNFLKIEQDKNGARKSCLWQFNPEKMEKVEQELNKYDKNEIQKSLRCPEDYFPIMSGEKEDYFPIMSGEKGMPPVSRRVKTPDFANESNDNTPKIMKQVVDYFSDATADQRSKQTVRQVAEQALNKLLKVKSEPTTHHPRVLQPVTSKSSVSRRQNIASTSYESSHSSSSDSNFSQKDYLYCHVEYAGSHELQYGENETDENLREFFDFSSYETQAETTPPDENVFPSSMSLSNFSLNGNPFRPFRCDGSVSIRPMKRPANPNLRPLGTIKDGQFISSSSKLLRLENDYDVSESKENMLI